MQQLRKVRQGAWYLDVDAKDLVRSLRHNETWVTINDFCRECPRNYEATSWAAPYARYIAPLTGPLTGQSRVR